MLFDHELHVGGFHQYLNYLIFDNECYYLKIFYDFEYEERCGIIANEKDFHKRQNDKEINN